MKSYYNSLLFFVLLLSGCFKDELVTVDSLTPGSELTFTPKSGTMTITSQKELRNFGEQGYRFINGGLVLTNITDLSPLSNLQGLSRNFEIIECPSLYTLNGLINLRSVGGNLIIEDAGIDNTKGLEVLEEVGGEIRIYSNYLLTTINGFESLSLVVGIDLDNCPVLKSINSFNKVTSLGSINSYGNLRIAGCHELLEISGFKELIEVPGKLEILSCNALRSLGTLNEIGKISSLHIEECNALQSINGFNQTELLGIFHLYDCDSLANIEGFANLQIIESLNFHDLPNLSYVGNLHSLRSIYGRLGITQSSIQNLDFLSNIDSIGFYGLNSSSLSFKYNSLLTDYCGLRNAVINPRISFTIWQNAYDPDENDLFSSRCKQ